MLGILPRTKSKRTPAGPTVHRFAEVFNQRYSNVFCRQEEENH